MTRFEAGTRVRTRAQRSSGHTRLPAYLQEKPGVIVASLGAFPLADDRADALPQPRSSELYTVEFDASDVWKDSRFTGRILADLFDEYLEPMP